MAAHTSKTIEQLKAEFAARGGRVTVAAQGIAYGVDAEADKAKREAERRRIADENYERDCEQYAERVREAYHVAGRMAAVEEMNLPRRWRA